ncbi:MAG: SLAC1 anion channel family protein [Elusimicrobiales bacterium]
MKERLKHFPVAAFSSVMGMTGLSIALGKFYHLQWLPRVYYDVSVFAALALFVFLAFVYALKYAFYPAAVKADFAHRIRVNFFSAISISLLLLSIAFYTYYPLLAIALWWAGALLHTVFMLKTIGFWIRHDFEIHQFSPIWFIPVVGNILLPVVGVDLAPVIISYFYFCVGFFFWLALFTLFLYRIVFHKELHEKFVPALFILLAPPAVGFVSYLRITASWDNFSVFLLLITYFFLALLLTLYRSFTRLKYFISWWAFTFPLAAVTIASAVAYQVTELAFFRGAATGLLALTAGVIALVIVHTVDNIRKGQICVDEELQQG